MKGLAMIKNDTNERKLSVSLVHGQPIGIGEAD